MLMENLEEARELLKGYVQIINNLHITIEELKKEIENLKDATYVVKMGGL